MDALPSSFRDPSGFVFSSDGVIYRQVNQVSRPDYDALMESGLYNSLVSKGLLVSHEEIIDGSVQGTGDYYKILRPTQIPFISYPYEWSFSQLKDAAMLTLRVQFQALKHGFTLKDASAFNIQFHNGKPVFIDTLSFESYVEGKPWVPYRQFCQHFLAPLSLMTYRDIDLSKLAINYIDGVPLTLASKLLPFKTRFNYSLATHIHLHSRIQHSYEDVAAKPSGKKRPRDAKLSKSRLQALLESLAKCVDKLNWKMPDTEWGDYYNNTNYSQASLDEKRKLVASFLANIPQPLGTIQDLGANTGEFSRIAADYASLVVSQDIDPVAVELNYREIAASGPENILPIVQNLVTPSPAIGWGNAERSSFVERSDCDVIMALALIHHIAISNNVPLVNVAKLFADMTDWLLIEFVPKSDSQVARLLYTREDIFPEYTREGFESAFKQCFSIERSENIEGTDRTLYLLKKLWFHQ